ncbi:MAG: sulfatase-like hydrolase/transferase, partial [Candidatus Brocadiaceae bacterium]
YLGWDNTILLVTSDHGQNLGEHGMFSHWLCLYETLLRVPLVLYPARGVPPGTRVGEPVQLSDVFDTMLDLAGCAGSTGGERTHGRRSLLARAAGRVPFDAHLFAEHSHPRMTLKQIRRHNPAFADRELESEKRAVRTGRYKYVRHGTGAEFLFDLHEDPGETVDVGGRHRRVRDEFRETLAERVRPFEGSAASAAPEEELGDAVLARLQDLGYC